MSEIAEQINAAQADRRKVFIRGGSSKNAWLPSFPDEERDADVLDMVSSSGVVNYQPEELVVTALAGTKLKEVNQLLLDSNQDFAFDPPQFSDSGTVGGLVASGLSGPTRAWLGSVRDAVLGVEVVNGRGEQLRFGGQVMKNVAGYDVSRLFAGSWGALGAIVSVSLRVQPAADVERTLQFELDAEQAVGFCRSLARQYLPLTGSWWQNGQLHLRLSGPEAAVTAAMAHLGGEVVNAGVLWESVRDHTHGFFVKGLDGALDDNRELCRLVVPPAAPVPGFDCPFAMEWGAGLRWVWHDSPEEVVAYARSAGGWCWVKGATIRVEAAQQKYMQRLKASFDPDDLFLSPVAGAS